MLIGTSLKLKLAKTVPRGERVVPLTRISMAPRALDRRHKPPSSRPQVGEVFGVGFEALFGEQVVDPLGAASLGAGVVGLESAAGRQPDRELGRNGLGRVAVADDFEKAAAVSEGSLVQNRRPRMALFGTGQWYSPLSIRSQSRPA